MKIDKAIKFRVTCTSSNYIHTLTSLQTDTISETFKEVMIGKEGEKSSVKSIEFEPMDKIIGCDYIV